RYLNPFIFILMLSSGTILSWANRSINHDTHFSKQVEGEQVFFGTVFEPPQEKARSVKAFIQISDFVDDSVKRPVQGNLLVYLEKSDRSKSLAYGDEIVFRSLPTEVKPPANPLQFNFKKHLENNDVYHQAYLKDQSWKIISKDRSNSIRSVAFGIRRYLLKVLKRHVPDDQD